MHILTALKDWPPEDHFRRDFPEIYDDFMSCLPWPDTMRLNGVQNLAAHFPTNGLPPDEGQ